VKANMAGIGLRDFQSSGNKGPRTQWARARAEVEGAVAGRIVVFVVLLSSPPRSSLSFCPAKRFDGHTRRGKVQEKNKRTM
jgi:hypothetical protein